MPTSPADIRKAALLSAATVAAGFVVPSGDMSIVGLPLAAFALGWLTYRFGVRPALMLAVVTAGCVAVLGPVVLGTSPFDGLYVGVALLALGPVAAMALRRYPALNVAAAAAAVTTLAFLVAPIGLEVRQGTMALIKALMDAMVAGAPASNLAAAKALAQEVMAQSAMSWPSTVFYMMGTASGLGVWLIGRAARSLDVPVHRYAALADTDISFHLMWPTIAGLAFSAAGTLWAQAPSWVEAIGVNALMIVRPFLFLQGAAVFAALYRKAGAGRISRAIGIVLLVLTEGFVPSVSILGAVDLFANLRKLPRAGGTTPTAVV